MIRLACLGRGYREQIDSRPDALQGVELVWQGTDVTQLLRLDGEQRPQVLVVDLESLDAKPEAALRALSSRLEPDLVLLVYRFARRGEISDLVELEDVPIRALQGPVTLTTIRGQMLGMIVRDLLDGDAGAAGAGKAICPECGRPL